MKKKIRNEKYNNNIKYTDSFIYECSKRSVALKRAGGLIENEL